MKIILTEEQTKKLTKSLINEQEESSTGSLANFFQKLVGGDNGSNNDNQTDTADVMDIGAFSGNINELTKLVINKLEGGYYHPDMLRDGRVKDGRYGNSGETMFGMDRKNGGSLTTSGPGRQFWSIIDNANARSKWKWNYGGGNLRPQLLELASQMIIPQYQNFSKRYLSPQAQSIVNSDKALTFNFLYATWNGSGWFKKFANKINDSVNRGITLPQVLSKIAIESRSQSNNSLISQQANKIGNIMNNLA